jgi:prepilin-type N-terminal cleavage/methylation domain-containing protein
MRRMAMKGFSLVEILVAMTLFLIVLVGVLNVFIELSRVRRRTEVLIEMQQNARFAVATLTNKIQVTGYQTPRDIALIPDPPCTSGCDPRVPNTDGIVLFVSMEDRHFLRPWSNLSPDTSCTDSSTLCDNQTCLRQSTLEVCTPTGFRDNTWNGQTVIVCGPVPQGTQVCNWRVPAPSEFVAECGLAPPGPYDLCCVARQVRSGPNCSAGCTRDAQGRCTGGTNCREVIQLDNTLPAFAVPSKSFCQFVPPVQAVHYQVHSLPDGRGGQRSYLVMRRNADPEWIPVAADIVAMNICYVFDPSCDFSQTCLLWTSRPTCPSGRPAGIRDIRRVFIQLTARTSRPVPVTLGTTENAGCLPGVLPAPPDLPEPFGRNVWRQYTACAEVNVRNLTYPDIIPTIW